MHRWRAIHAAWRCLQLYYRYSPSNLPEVAQLQQFLDAPHVSQRATTDVQLFELWTSWRTKQRPAQPLASSPAKMLAKDLSSARVPRRFNLAMLKHVLSCTHVHGHQSLAAKLKANEDDAHAAASCCLPSSPKALLIARRGQTAVFAWRSSFRISLKAVQSCSGLNGVGHNLLVVGVLQCLVNIRCICCIRDPAA